MKEAIEDLIENYLKKVEELSKMIQAPSSYMVKVRLEAKRSTYRSVANDLKNLLKDEQDEA